MFQNSARSAWNVSCLIHLCWKNILFEATVFPQLARTILVLTSSIGRGLGLIKLVIFWGVNSRIHYLQGCPNGLSFDGLALVEYIIVKW